MVTNIRITGRLRLALLPLLLVLSATVARAQNQNPIVTGQSSQAFGTLFRSSTSSLGYSNSGAALFRVEGKKHNNVRLTVSKANLTRSGNSLPLTISNSDCAYSTDDGTTWYTFSTGTLYQDATFPNGQGQTTYIYVRVGGSVTSSSSQVRGQYTGSVTLTAAYR